MKLLANNIKSIVTLSSLALFVVCGIIYIIGCREDRSQKSQKEESYFIVAYISGGEGKAMPNFDHFTHLNYAFGRVADSFDGVDIENVERFRKIARAKNEYNSIHKDEEPKKMLLSIGGWGSGRFSEMVTDSVKRGNFVESCKNIVEDFEIDGIDLDWEYPSSNVAGISANNTDIDNFTLLVKELREAIGSEKLLTIATISSARFIDFDAVDPYIDFYNIMSYDMAVAPYHHAPLKRFDISDKQFDSLFTDIVKQYPPLADSTVASRYDLMYQTPIYIALQSETIGLNASKVVGQSSMQEALYMHLYKGLNRKKLNLGIPFYGKTGGEKSYQFQRQFSQSGDPGAGYVVEWDDIAKVPFVADSLGDLIYGYENEQSLKEICDYIKNSGLMGGMYWEYCIDTTFAKNIKIFLNKE